MTNEPSQTRGDSTDRLLAGVVLALTIILWLLWSSNLLMSNDEFLSFYTDSVPTVAGIIAVQLHYPISLDPPAYHLLSHFFMDLIGRNATALRLPALAGFLLLELALFSLVRRLAGSRSAVIAMLFPLLTASFDYSVEGRPYSLLLGLYAVAFLCWFVASQTRRTSSRILALVGLATSIALAITSHYFGVLILIPVSCAELARIIHRRRLDRGITIALLLGMAFIALVLPFQRGLAPYQAHYYNHQVSMHNVSQGYRELFIRYTTWPMPLQKLAALLLVLATLALAIAAYRRFRNRPADEPASLWIGLAALAALPFFGFLLGRFVTHTMEVRYVIATLIAFAVCIGLVLEARLRSNVFYIGLLAVMFFVAVLENAHNIQKARHETAVVMHSFHLSPRLAAALANKPNDRIYVQTLDDFYVDSYYAPDPALRARFSLLYGQDQEIHWLGHDTNYVTATNMAHFTPLSTTSYADFLAQSQPLLIDYGPGWDWIAEELNAAQIPERHLGPALGGDAIELQLPAN